MIGKANNNAVVVPVKKLNNVIKLSKFDNQRFIVKTNKKNISFGDIYEKKEFANTKNDYLTSNEVKELHTKFKV